MGQIFQFLRMNIFSVFKYGSVCECFRGIFLQHPEQTMNKENFQIFFPRRKKAFQDVESLVGG